jgi:hypothetical protein
MTTTNRRLVEQATGQLGALSREQAHAIGMSDEQLRSRVQSGFLLQPGPNVFRLSGAQETPRSRLRALILDIGGDALASRYTAAALHGFDGYRLDAPFDVTISRNRQVHRHEHRIHTVVTMPLIDRMEIDGIPTTRAARTLIDLARHESAAQLTVALDSALRDRIVSEEALHRRIVALRRQGMHGIPRLLEVLEGVEAMRGGHSWLEREFLRLMAEAGLPRPEPQVAMTKAGNRLVRVDFFFPGTNVVVEVLGYRWHRSSANLTRDTERLNALLDSGVRPYQFTYATIVESPTAVVTSVRQALAS